jgi:TfoX/Sxy family transcriptional regulator of competence genes
MGPFQYERKGKMFSLGYHEVPVDVLEDGDALAEWAAVAHNIALSAKKPKSRKSKSL